MRSMRAAAGGVGAAPYAYDRSLRVPVGVGYPRLLCLAAIRWCSAAGPPDVQRRMPWSELSAPCIATERHGFEVAALNNRGAVQCELVRRSAGQ
jgi:hypothetical protein